MSLDWLPGLDLSTGTFTLPLWVVGVAAALFVALIIIAIVRSGLTELGSLAFRIAIIAIAVVFGWTYLNRSGERDRADERRALDQRAADLVGRAVVPGSAIACLEATNTDTVEGACERAVFASPETVAAATAYLSARLSLLADASDYTAKRDQSYESAISGLRRTIAADRYGLASQVLATRDGCTADACDAFSLVYDDKKLKANLRDRLFDVTVARYAVNWPTRSRPLASSAVAGAEYPPARRSRRRRLSHRSSTPSPPAPPNQAAAPAAARRSAADQFGAGFGRTASAAGKAAVRRLGAAVAQSERQAIVSA